MKKRCRLLRSGDFQRVLASPPVFQGRTIVAFATVDRRADLRPAGVGVRIGVAAARRISGQVARNRAKRRVREAVRVSLPAGLGDGQMGTPYDVVLIARLAALTEPLDRITADLRRVWERLGS
ncbi:MAG: ribonuclease P protein component [Candidatus Dormibacteraeota bacterium]|nr:ribonuclease P protein component [Candidatus Dormibacteraeota bacterium]